MQFDIVILGSNLVGAALACALRGQGLKIALIEKNNPCLENLKRETEDFLNAKALALNHVSIECLKAMHLWPAISVEASPIVNIHVSRQGYFGVNRISSEEYGLRALGYVVNAEGLLRLLNETVNGDQQCQVFYSQEVCSLERIDNLWKVKLKDGIFLTTPLLIGADGAHSFLRKHQGIQVKTHDYEQSAIVVNVELSRSHDNIAYERFTREGSIAFLPFGKHLTKCVWVVPQNNIERLLNLSEIEFLNTVQTIFGYRLGPLLKAGKRTVYPLRSSHAHSIYGDGFVLVGNAANTLHPVAAQGFNLGLRDIATLAELLISAKKELVNIGSLSVLQAYAEARSVDHIETNRFSHLLTESTFKRNVGIVLSEWLNPLKRRVANQGLGSASFLPKLCRGVSL